MPDTLNGNQPPETPPAAPETTPETPDAPPSGLPSDNQPDPLNIQAPEGQKFGGKFDSTQAMLDHIKAMEDKYANAQRELANRNNPDGKDNQTPPKENTPAAPDPEVVAKQREVIEKDLMPQFMQNGMVITPEMEQKAVEVGIDPRDLKLNAYELKERLSTSFEITGGQENYTAMIEWGKANLNEAQKIEFDRALKSGMSQYAVKGLWYDYMQATGGQSSGDRLRGNPSPSGLQPYADRKELYKDKDYIESPAGRHDKAAIRRYRERLRITPDEVLGL